MLEINLQLTADIQTTYEWSISTKVRFLIMEYVYKRSMPDSNNPHQVD